MINTTITNQDKIKYLKRYILLDREINRKLDEVSRWRVKLEKVTAVYTAEPKGGGSIYSKTESIVARIVDLEREINQEIDELVTLKANIESLIDSVENDQERLLLQYRYLDGRTFEWIAAEMCYSWRQIHRLHSKALINLKMS